MDGSIDVLGFDVHLCLFAVMTGTACPGCGLTRAVLALLAGDYLQSWRYHPLAVPVMGQTTMLGWVWVRSVRGDRTRGLDRVHIVTAAALGVLLLVVWAVRWMTKTLPPV